MSDTIEQISRELLHALDTDQLVLPTLPEVALKVREVSSDPDVDVATLSKVIENDPAISARIVKISNSPLLRASRPIEDLKMAVSRLGINYTSNLATSLAMQQMFQATSDVIDQRMREVWAHSTEVSGIAHVLARHYTKLRPDQATLAGIVHQIGVLPILTFAEDNRRLLKDTVALDELITSLHPLLGRRILEAWNFPEELCIVPQEHVNFGRSREKPDYSDVVMVANLQSYIGTDHPFTQLDWTMISAFDRLGLEPEVNTMEAEDLTADMEAAMAFLQ
jgi:HD-like signal output (HDOD) protein